MIMVGGYDRYFQFARCYRDEDLRADRQPEFTQIDLEMSFVTPIDIQNVIEHLITSIWSSVKGINIPTPFPRMSYQVAMEKYGVDKPDTRFGMEIQDLQNVFKDSTYISSNHPAVCGFSFNIPKELKSKFLAKYEKMYSGNESFKLFQVSSQESSGGKKLVPEIPLEYFTNSNVSVQADDFVFVATGVSKNKLLPVLGKVRLQFATFLEELDYPIRDLNRFDFLWVEDFPLFSESETQEGVLEATHHPFTAPHPDDLPILFTDPKRVRGLHYDVVVNGWELGGGSIRVHNSEFQEKIIKDILKSDSTKFSHLLKALKTGAPPHGGIALGFDRLMAILLGTKSIREVIAFPKSFSGKDLTCDSPSKVSNSELREYGLEMSLKK